MKANLPSDVLLPTLPDFATNNAHMFYLICPTLDIRSAVIAELKEHQILAVFHYLSLHTSPYYSDKHDGRKLINCDRYADHLIRLPLYVELADDQIDEICRLVVSVLKS